MSNTPNFDSGHLLLFVSASTRGAGTFANAVRATCAEEGVGWRMGIVNVVDQPDIAERFGIVATPTLLRLIPKPVARLVGHAAPGELRSFIRQESF